MAEDRRELILNAGLALIREQGLAGLTQPRLAANTGLRQSHLTYYYPTRADLLEAVARRAMAIQIDSVRTLLRSVSSVDDGARKFAKAVCRHENTRVLSALNQAADQEPGIREPFTKLLKDFVDEIAAFMSRIGLPPTQARIDLVHSLFVGVSIIDLATGRAAGEKRAAAIFKLAFQLLAEEKR